MLWAVFTLIAAAAQTARNAMQRELTATLGTVGATHVRFLFGFPFALLFLAGCVDRHGRGAAEPPHVFWPWVIAGAFTQIAATATMLSVMGQRSFVVAYAYIKTEPVHVALFGLVFLGDKITPLSAAAILLATAGVIVDLAQGCESTKGPLCAPPPLGSCRVHCSGFPPSVIAAPSCRIAPAGLRGGGNVYRCGWPGDPGGGFVALSCAAGRQGSPRHRRAHGGPRFLRVSWALSRRNSGFWPLRSRPPPMCARWRWSRCCSRKG